MSAVRVEVANRLLIVLTERVKHALRALPRGLGRASVFANPVTGAAWVDIRKSFHRALEAAKLEGLWFHDLRRSFVTRLGSTASPSRW